MHYRRPHVRQIAILLTDGQSTIETERTIPEADIAKLEQIIMFAIGGLLLHL